MREWWLVEFEDMFDWQGTQDFEQLTEEAKKTAVHVVDYESYRKLQSALVRIVMYSSCLNATEIAKIALSHKS
jgi:hypothetical protein